MPQQMLNLITVGDNCLDVYLTKDHMAVGGNALNVAAQWRLHGYDARYFGVVGPDDEGRAILAGLDQAGLPPGDVEIHPGSTAVTLLLERNGDRRFLLEDLGVGLNYRPDAARYAALLRADWVHLGTNTAPDLLRDLIRDGAMFSLDISTVHDRLPLAGVSLVFASGPEDPAIPVAPLLHALRERGAVQAVVTCGGRGAFMLDGAHLVQVPAQKIAVVDTCGAGDSFIAAFLLQHLRGGVSPVEALSAATAAATRTCLHEGGFPQSLNPIPEWLLHKYADVIASAEG
ncbi:MAG TPA: PfkB family carbohydrate kinase [Paenirhodobacter sp.]